MTYRCEHCLEVFKNETKYKKHESYCPERPKSDDSNAICEDCGREVNANSMTTHKKHCDGTPPFRLILKVIVRETHGYIPDGNVVYIGKFKSIEDGREFLYVGRTSNILNRMQSHNNHSHCIVGLPDGNSIKSHQYTVVDIIDIVECKSKEHSKYREQMVFRELIKSNPEYWVTGGN